MSAKTHIPRKVTFTDSGTYLFWGNPLPVGPSSSLFQLPSTSCHSPTRHFIQSHRMAAPLHPVTQNGGPSASGARELVSSHTVPFLCLVLFSPRILREPLSLSQDFALLSLSQGSFPLNMVPNNEAPFPTTTHQHPPHSISQHLPSSFLALFLFRIEVLSAGHPLGVCHLSVSLMRMAFTRGGIFVYFVHCCNLRF